MTASGSARVALAGVIVLTMAVTDCSAGAGGSTGPADPDAPEQSELGMATYRQRSVAPALAASDEGIFDDYGVSIEPSYVESSAAGMAALIGGDVDIAYSSYRGVIDAKLQGIDLAIVAENIRFAPGALTFEALPESGFESLADLEGATVSVPALNSGHHNRLRYAMIEEGLEPGDVEFVELPFGEIASALQNETVDVAAAGGPALTALKEEFDSVTVLDIADGMFADATEGGWIMSRSLVDANPNTVAAFQCAWLEGVGLVEDDELYAQILVDHLGFDEATAQGEIAKKPIFPTEIDTEKIQQFADIMLELDLIDSEIDMSELIVPLPEDC